MSKTYFVVGTGKSGIAATELLLRMGETPILYDGNADADLDKVRAEHPEFKDVEMQKGEISEELLQRIDVVVLSPGVPTDIPMVEDFKTRNLPIWGEVELAYQMGKGQVVGITGTNGKTTTTALTGEIMKEHFNHVFVVGNIGIPYTTIADQTEEDSVSVAEISSFMLETIEEFHPHVSAILNITPDHLNRHHTMENYIKAKENITCNQTEDDVVVLNYEDEVLRKFGEVAVPKVIYFSSRQRLEDGLYYEDGAIYWSKNGEAEEVIKTSELNILGLHNFENVMAAVAMGASMGVSMEEIREALRTFQAVEHRIEYVCEKRGIRFYNDSKGTNPDAAIKGIQAMDRRTCLIGGGYDKQNTYDEWIESFDGKVKKLVLIGQTREDIAACCDKHDFHDYCFAETLEEAIDLCYEAAESGEAILLSPACASWGMFPNYEERGRIFKEYVRNLKEA
ncbi:UDP-N-acetylmuramoylalanine--D-glutamate ligase [Lachnospiraceae bacterium A10]|nr:UDP-N-acetylmuramoylalanine--D-glutamate ligase [Lachnospiraceae bacterium A10]